LYACGRSKRRTTDQTAPTGAAVSCNTAEQHCPARAACSWCRATSAGTDAHDAPCDAFDPAAAATRLCWCADGRGLVHGIIASIFLLLTSQYPTSKSSMFLGLHQNHTGIEEERRVES
jgi:hypothetical protein